ILLFKGTFVGNLKNEIPLWDINSAGPEIKSSIQKQLTLIHLIVVLSFTFLISTGLLYLTQLSKDVEIFFGIRFFQDYYPNYYLLTLYRSTFPIVILCLGQIPF